MYWVFHAKQLETALAEFRAKREREGATEQQAKDEAAIVEAFLISDVADRAKLIGGRG